MQPIRRGGNLPVFRLLLGWAGKWEQPVLELSRRSFNRLPAEGAPSPEIPFQSLEYLLSGCRIGGRGRLRSNDPPEPPPGCGQILVFHLVLEPISAAAPASPYRRFAKVAIDSEFSCVCITRLIQNHNPGWSPRGSQFIIGRWPTADLVRAGGMLV